MSMLGTALLNEIINEKNIYEPADILDMLKLKIIMALRQSENASENKDGMDIALLCFDKEKQSVQYAGAFNSLYHVRNGELWETKADMFPIGIHIVEDMIPFSNHTIELQKGDSLYIFSDGYADQFSPEDKKLMTRKFKEIILSIQHLSMVQQKEHLDIFTHF